MSAPNKRDLKAFSSVKVRSSAPTFKGFASSTWLLQLLCYSMGSINLGVVPLLLPWECSNPMKTLSVSSCGYVWRWANNENADPLIMSNIYCPCSGLQIGFRPGCSALLLENNTQNPPWQGIHKGGREVEAWLWRDPTPESKQRCQNCTFP